jgi:hypothetical protein
MWLQHIRKWFLHAECADFHMQSVILYAECDFQTHECNLDSYECDYDIDEYDYECDFHTQCDIDSHEWDNDTHDCNFNMHKYDFYSQSVISTRMSVIYAHMSWVSTRCVCFKDETTKINVRLPKKSGLGSD